MENNACNLKGKRVLVTGGSSGIGKVLIQFMAAEGAKIITLGRSEKKLNDMMQEIDAKNGEVFCFTADVADEMDIEKVFKTVDSQFGELDILINNASLAANSILDVDQPSLDYVMKVNFLAYLKIAKEAVGRMKKGGHIINIGSLSSKVADPESDLYVATKSGVEGFSDALRKKVNGQGIKVTLIRPGLVNTPIHDLDEKGRREFIEEKMILAAESIAGAVCFALTQDESCEIMQIDIKPSRQIV